VLGFHRAAREVAANLYRGACQYPPFSAFVRKINVRHLLLPYLACNAPAGGWRLPPCNEALSNGAHVPELNLLELQRLDDDGKIVTAKEFARSTDIGAEIANLLFN